jgi:hypothetical protein
VVCHAATLSRSTWVTRPHPRLFGPALGCQPEMPLLPRFLGPIPAATAHPSALGPVDATRNLSWNLEMQMRLAAAALRVVKIAVS